MSKIVMYLNKKLIITSAFCCLCLITHAQDADLFKAYTGELSTVQQELINTLESKQTTTRTRVATINKRAFERNEMTVNLFNDQTLTFQARPIGVTGVNYRTWTGISVSNVGSAAAIINGNRISAHISSLDGSYEILPLDNVGTHLILEHDVSKYGSCANNEEQPRIMNDNESEISEIQVEKAFAQRSPGSSECRIRLLIAYTPGAQTNTMMTYNRSMIEHIELAILQMNQGFANSLVDQRVELAHLYRTTDEESENSTNDINDLRDTSDGKWDEIHDLRNVHNADMVALITDGSYADLCGLAYGFNYDLEDNMFQITEYNCAVGNFTLAHEFGHLQGCRHNVDGNDTPFAFGHGYSQGGVYQTIMAVCCGGVRVNFWSNPYVYYPGVGQMGTLNFNYNAQALNISDSTIAHHRLTPSSIDSDDILDDDHLVNSITSGLVISTDTTMNGGCLILQSETRIRLASGFRTYNGSHGKYRISNGCSMPEPLAFIALRPGSQRDGRPIDLSSNSTDLKDKEPEKVSATRDQRN